MFESHRPQSFLTSKFLGFISILNLIIIKSLNSIQKTEIQNWPATPCYEQLGWISSIVMLGVLIFQSVRARKEYTRSIRPFVSAANFDVLSGNNIVIQIDEIMFQLTNAPTRIQSLSVKILNSGYVIHSYTEKNFVRFLGTQWTYKHTSEDFSKILKEPIENCSNFVRKVEIKYSPLDDKKEYFFDLEQKFNPKCNRWDDTHSSAD